MGNVACTAGSAHYLETALLSPEVRGCDDGLTDVMTSRIPSVARGNHAAGSLLSGPWSKWLRFWATTCVRTPTCAEGSR